LSGFFLLYAGLRGVVTDCVVVRVLTVRRHTHFGCDQVFSRHAVFLRAHDAKTLPALADALVKSWSSNQGMGRVEVLPVEMAADVKGWLKDHLDPRLHNHTKGHQYVFESKVYNGEEQVVLTVKNFSVSKPENWAVVGPLLRVRFVRLKVLEVRKLFEFRLVAWLFRAVAGIPILQACRACLLTN
jgi:hypothetical protein